MADLARVIQVAEAVAVKIRQAAGNDGTRVERVYEIDLDADPTKWPAGRRVFVVPFGYDQPEAAARGHDTLDHRIGVIVANRVPPKTRTPAPVAWVDEQVTWVESRVFDPLADDDLELLDAQWSQEAGVEAVYDARLLREKGVFWSEAEFVFREIAE